MTTLVNVKREPEEHSPVDPERAASEKRRTPRILVVDDHPAVRRGLVLVLDAAGIGVCREAGGRAEALDVAGRELLDLALVGLSMNQEESIALVSELRARRIPVLVCSQQERPALVKRAMAAGARAYITKREAPLEIVRVVRDVLAGWVLISPGAAEDLDEGWWEWLSSREFKTEPAPSDGTHIVCSAPFPEGVRNDGKNGNPQDRREKS